MSLGCGPEGNVLISVEVNSKLRSTDQKPGGEYQQGAEILRVCRRIEKLTAQKRGCTGYETASG